MRNYQIISGFAFAQENLLISKQSTGFYDTKKTLVFNTNFLYTKDKNLTTSKIELKAFAKTYFTKRDKDLVLNFEILADDFLSKKEKKYAEELRSQIAKKILLLNVGKKPVKDIIIKTVAEINADEKLFDIIEETKITPHPKSNAAWIAKHKDLDRS